MARGGGAHLHFYFIENRRELNKKPHDTFFKNYYHFLCEKDQTI